MNKKILGIVCKSGLFFSLVTFIVCALAVFDYKLCLDYPKSQYNTADTFYESECFAKTMDQWAVEMNSYIASLGYSDIRLSGMDMKQAAYYTVEYSDILDVQPADGIGDIDKENWIYKRISVDQLYSEMPKVAANISNGSDMGNDDYLFYSQLKDYIENRYDGEECQRFLHIKGKDYYSLLNKYLEEGVMNDVFVANNFAESYNGMRDYDNALGFYNKYNNSVVAYAATSKKGLGHFVLEVSDDDTGNYFFDYSLRDAGMDQNFYIPVAALNTESIEDFEKSIITTPFSTVKSSMAYINMQNIIGSQQYGGDYWNVTTINQLQYNFFVDNEFSGYYAEYNTSEEDIQSDKENAIFVKAVCNNGKWSFDNDSKNKIKKQKFNFSEDFLNQLPPVIKGSGVLYIGVPNGFGFNLLSLRKCESFIVEHNKAFSVISLISCILMILFGIGICFTIPAGAYRRDCHYLIGRTLVYGGLSALIILVMVVIICGCISLRIRLASVVECMVFICFMLLLSGIVYILLLDYFIGNIRLMKTGQWTKYILSLKLFVKLKAFAVKFFKNVCKSFDTMCRIPSLTVRSLIIVGLYFVVEFFLIMFFLASKGGRLFFFAIGVAWNLYGLYSVFLHMRSMQKMIEGVKEIVGGDLTCQIDTADMKGDQRELAGYINKIGDGLDKAVAVSLRDERLKAELITNVSHDIKTPLTSIINYVDLIKREGVEEEPIKGYVEVLNQKSLRLKQLIEDLVEVSKASTGNIELLPANLNMVELVNQAIGEFEDKFSKKNLTIIPQIEDYSMVIYADGRRCYRIIENLLQNVYKYAMENTRVYFTMNEQNGNIVLCIKNISEAPLNVPVEELTQRFVRGEESRTTEGSGLGLSIAKSLTELQNGTFEIALDGDLFKVTVTFPSVKEQE